MLTAKVSENNRIKGLSVGADDYMIKPFDPREVVARVRAILRRTDDHYLLADRLAFNRGELTIDSLKQRVYCSGELVSLTPNEYKLLLILAKHPQRIFHGKSSWNECSDLISRAIVVQSINMSKTYGKNRVRSQVPQIHCDGVRIRLPFCRRNGMNRLHTRLALIIIGIAVGVVLISTVSLILTTHYHFSLYQSQVDQSHSFPELDYHLEQALIQTIVWTCLISIILAVFLGFYG